VIGTNYWTTGIVVSFWPPALYSNTPRYGARLQFFDGGFAQEGSTEGELRVRYLETDLSAMLDTLIADATRLGIEFKTPHLMINSDGEDAAEYLPGDWKAQLQAQAARLGWATYADDEEVNRD
jgi:hypothetical protein